MTVFRLLLLAALAALAGLALVSRLGRERRSGPGAVGLAFVVGTLALALWTHLLLFVRVPVTAWTVAAGGLAILPFGRWRFLKELVWKRPPWPAWLLVPAAGFLVYGALCWPLIGVDPATFYSLKGKSIATHGTFWNEDFTDAARPHPCRRRPLLLPSMYADVYLVAGTEQGEVLRLWFALFQIAALAAMYDALRGKMDRRAAAAATALFAWLPALWHDAGGAMTPYADAPLGMIFLFALSSEAPLSMFFLAAGVLLKDEGLAFLLPFALFRNWKLTLIPGILGAAWLVTASTLPGDWTFFPQYLLQPQFSRVFKTLTFLPRDWVSLKHWGLLWVIILAVLALRIRRLDRQDARWLLPLGLQLCIYTGIYLAFPMTAEFARMLRWSSMRYLMHIAPSAWAWAARRTATPEHALAPAAPAR